MNYKNIYTTEALELFKNLPPSQLMDHQKSFSKTIIQTEDSFIKICLGPNVIEHGNYGYYKKHYNSVHAGIEDAIKIINSIDDCIIDYDYKDNFYLYVETKKVDSFYELHSAELIEQFDCIEDYIIYFKNNVKSRYDRLEHLIFNDYHVGNIMVDKDLNWTNIDQDGILRYGVGTSKEEELDLVQRRLWTHGELVKYDANYLRHIWESN